jgi:glycosyltransferase involved in cell wall biosynthesis
MKRNARPRIAIDFSRLDHASLGAGQYRYAVDLLLGLSELRPAADFVVLGSRPAPVPELAPLFAAGGWDYRQLELATGRGAWLRDQFAFRRALQRERIALLHSLQSPVPVLAPCPVVVTVHDAIYDLFPEYETVSRSREHRLFRWAVRRRAARAICISQATANDIASLWRVLHAKLDVIHHGTAMKAAPGAKVPVFPFLLSPYNLEPRKNLSALISALKLLAPEFRDLKLVLYGRAAITPEREQQFRSEIRAAGIEDRIVLTGLVDDPALAALYTHCAAFVFPSLYEGFGLPLLEAMACGACVVAHNESAMAEIAGNAGILLDMRSPQQLAVAVSSLLRDPEKTAQLRRAALARSADFTVERMARATLAVYSRVLGRQNYGIIEADNRSARSRALTPQ